MLKFIKHHMASIDGIEVFPIISFLLFFLFFIVLTVYVVMMDKGHVKEMKNVPLGDNPTCDINE